VEFRIVGVTADIRNAGLRRPAEPEILIPFMQSPWVGVSFLAYAPQAGSGLLERMQEAVWAVDPDEAMSRVYRLQDEIDAQLAQVIYFTRVLGGFALLAALLAAFGTYSVIALMQRRQVAEIGVRLALGARPASVAWRVFAQGLSLALIAGFAGSLGSIVVLRLLRSQLYGVEVTSPQLYILGIGGALVAALLATAVPAWRAACIQPIVALRYE
jgi:ABC-type antimicrobial peptide transport system permease subunit